MKNRKILILGMGREGLSTFTYIRKLFPDKQLGVADKTPFDKLNKTTKDLIGTDKNISPFFGNDYLKNINKYEILFKSPGISPFIKDILNAQKNGTIISSNIELFFEKCQGKIIGITGTKGKSTTSSLIYEVLKNGGYHTKLIGNIGTPALTELQDANPSTIFIVELSSFQLMGLKKSPHISVVLNIAQEHLDYHKTFEAYINAKQNITLYQKPTDYLIFNNSDPILNQISQDSLSKKLTYGFNKGINTNCFLETEHIVYQTDNKLETITPISSIPLKGRHNLLNVMPSILIGKHYFIDNKLISNTIKNFKPLEHRLEYVCTINHVSFFNDSLATIPEATINAIDSFKDTPLIIIAGGLNRGQNFANLAKSILKNKIKALLFFPTTGDKIWEEIQLHSKNKDNLPKHTFVTNMKDAVNEAWDIAEKGDVILLSPASVSFVSFKDYADRGKQFKDAVKKLN